MTQCAAGCRRLLELKRNMEKLGKTGKERDAVAEERKRLKADLADVCSPLPACLFPLT